MNVGILSMQRVDNMGSLLQSYALKKTIEELGHQVGFIDIKKIDEDYELLGAYKQDYHEEREAIGLLGKIKKIDKYTINRFRIKKKSIQQEKAFEDFRNSSLSISNTKEMYDVCVIGSDEVFNCLSSGAWGFTSQLFGNVSNANKVITYAASCGSTEYEELPNGVINRIKEAFLNVSSFSTRDQNTHCFVAKLTDKSITDNFDPVLIYDFGHEIEATILPELPKNYCVVYSYYNRIHSNKEINAIKSFCKKYDLTPIAIGAPQYWIGNYIVCSPFQCLKVFKNAKYVITDTFHGTIFAAKYSDKFAVLARESNRNKLLDLVKKIGMQEHLMESITELEDKYQILKNQNGFNEIIAEERVHALQYLQKNI